MQHLGSRKVGYKQASQQDRFKRPRLEQSPHPPHPTYGKPVPFNLRREVFLSHSGKDKEFVRHLHKALCSSYQGIKVAFFDEQTIPKAEAVSMENILEEARKSKLGVLVLTDDFFTHTQNPMLELEAFVDAEVKLLPLFLTMSVEQFKEKERRDRWMKKWTEWSAVDDKLVNLESWGHALSLVSTFSGLEFCKTATCQSDYIDKIVKQVTRIIGPAIPLSKADVIHGRDRLCQMADALYEKATSKHFSFAQNVSNTQAASYTSPSNFGPEEECCNIISTVVGIHGFTGLGKSTFCKWLCDYYHGELNGRVCYIDVGLPRAANPEQNPAISFRGRLQHVLKLLSPCNNAMDHLQYLDDDQLENVLRAEFSSMKDPVFFAIDNITSERKSQEEADLYLSCEFPKGSRIFLTSRSESVLANLIHQYEGSFSVAIAYMPCLEFQEARDIFVQEFPQLRKLGITNQLGEDVNTCVKLCTIHCNRYHPLMLKSLAAFLKWDRSTSKYADWKGSMVKLQLKGIESMTGDVWSKVFSVFEMAYELLSEETRKVFLDLVLFYNTTGGFYDDSNWISMLHSHLGETVLGKILLELQDTCFIGKTWLKMIEIPDLMVDFGKYKAKQEETYLVLDDSTIWPDHDRLPSSARHISISRVNCKASRTQLVDLRGMKGVEVLHLVDNAGLQEVLLSPTTCARLRSLILIAPKCTTLRCTLDGDWPSSSPPRPGGPFLKWTKLQGDVSFQCTGASQLSEIGLSRANHDTNFQSLTNLEISNYTVASPASILTFPCSVEFLCLSTMPNVQSMDLTACANLKNVILWDMPSLIKFVSPEGNSHRLQSVGIFECPQLLAVTISENPQTSYQIKDCPSLQTLSCWAGSGAEWRREGRQGNLRIAQRSVKFNLIDVGQLFRFPIKLVTSEAIRPEDLFGHLPIKDAEVDCLMCKARVVRIKATGYSQAGLASVRSIKLLDAQHIGLFVSALFEAQPEELRGLKIRCKSGGDCGCNQVAPHFGPLPWNDAKCFKKNKPCLSYRCPQVTDLASLGQWHVLKRLDLEGCKSVEVWPDFTAMSGLEELNLRNTSLKEWPAAVLLLPRLRHVDLSGCPKIPTKELLFNSIIAVPESMTTVQLTCRGCSLLSLAQDLREGIRDRSSVADALGVYSPELLLLFDRGYSSNCMYGYRLLLVQKLAVEVIHVVWFGGVVYEGLGFALSETENAQGVVRSKMWGLLCSESFLSLPFRACKELIALNSNGSVCTDEMFPYRLSEERYCKYSTYADIIRRDSEKNRDWMLEGMMSMGMVLVGEVRPNFRRRSGMSGFGSYPYENHCFPAKLQARNKFFNFFGDDPRHPS